jgi:hypothetical protein
MLTYPTLCLRGPKALQAPPKPPTILSSPHSGLECENLTIKSLTADTNYYDYILLNNVALNNTQTNCCPYGLYNIHTLDTLARDTLRLA